MMVENHLRKILIVDDEEPNRLLLEAILKSENYSVLTASNGAEAVQLVQEQQPHLVIMDVCMPVMNGLEACQKIKSISADGFVPIILLTGLSDEESQVRGFEAGADEYIVKPPSKLEMLARIRAMFRIRDLHHKLLQSNSELEETNAALIEARQMIEDDLKIVGSIQKSFLPEKMPEHPQISFGRYYEPCEQAGGDYYDLIEIGHNNWGLLIADVTGHGTPAAVVMAMTHTLMHSFSKSFLYPSTALKVVNEKLNQYLAPTFYVTMFYGILNLDHMSFRFASAGHEPMILYQARTQTVELLKTQKGFPLKFKGSDEYDETEVILEPQDKLILFTDGIVEHRNQEGDLFGTERLTEFVLKHQALPAQHFVDAIINEIKAFHPDQNFHDDVTLFVIQNMNYR